VALPEAADTAAPPGETETVSIGESRLPPAAALIVFMALNIALRVWLPNEGVAHTPWLVPAIEAVLLAVLLTSDPGSLAKRAHWLHRVSVTLVSILVLAALWATALLVYDLIKGSGVTNSPSELLASGGVVWLGNNLSFALLYWLIDSGGPIAKRPRSTSPSRSR
jgi:hypothetical protein